MIDILLERLKKVFDDRYLPIILIYIAFFITLVVRIFNIQIAQNDKLWSDDDGSSTKIRELKSARGNILDRNGVLLAYNKLSYSITLEDSGGLSTSTEKNAMIFKLISIIENYGGELANDFFIKMDDDGNLYFKETGKEEYRFKRDAYSKKSVDDLTEAERDSTADDVYEFLRIGKGSNSTSMFNIDEKKYSKKDILKIMQIRYYLMLNKFEKYMPITIATNVNSKTVAAINEYSGELPGVDVLSETYRVYDEAEIFAHMMGYTGLISPDKLQEFSDAGNTNYSATDQIGKTGLEEYLEDYLHGVKGSETVKINANSEIEDIVKKTNPVAGDDVYLTIDSNLQKASYTLLEKEIAGIILGKLVNQKKGATVKQASDIQIPVYDVYYSLIDNNVINIDKLSKAAASSYSKSAYNKFISEQKSAIASIKNTISFNSTQKNSDLDDFMKEYVERIYNILVDDNILVKSKINTEDSTYVDYTEGNISLSKFLQYSFENGWINTQKLEINEEAFYSTSELYSKLLDYIMNKIADDKTICKITYKSLIESATISGTELCIILIEQKVINDESSFSKLKSGSLSAFKFIKQKLKTLELSPGKLALDPCSGSVVVTNVKNGDVYAMVSYPSYDNNQFANVINADYYNSLLEDESDVLVNRATLTRTAPGSTFKMVTAAAGLEEGVIWPGRKIYDRVKFTQIGNPPSCYSTYGHGSIDVIKAIGVSCNYFFYQVGFELSLQNNIYNSEKGLGTIEKYASMFGFDAKSGVEIAEYTPGISNEDAVRSAIGQGKHAFAPIQIARYATSVANNGTVYDLTLVDKVKDLKGNVIKDNKAKVHNTVKLKDSTWKCIHEGMHTVVYGSSSAIKKLYKGLKIEVAGKTGTAQQVKTRPSHALFVSYAPYDNPEIAVTCVIPFGYGSYNAADLAQQIYQYYYELTDTDVLIDANATESNVDTSQQD